MLNNNIFKLLKNHSFLFLWLAQVSSQIAINMMNFVLLLHLAQITKSNTADSLFIISITLPAVFLGSLAGVFVDRWQKRKVLLICNLLRVLVVLFFVVNHESLFFIFLLAITASIITQFFVPAEAPLIPEIVSKELLLSANSLFTMTFFATVMFGFMLAGPALTLFGTTYVFLFIAFLFTLATLFIWLIPTPLKKSVKPGNIQIVMSFTQVLEDLKVGYEYLKASRKIKNAIFLMSASQVLITTMSAIAPGYAATVLNIDITNASLYIVAPAAIGMIVGALFMGIIGIKIEKEKITNYSILAGGILLAFLSFLSRGKYRTHLNFDYLVRIDILHLAVVIFFFLGIINALISVAANTILQEEALENVRSRIYGFLTAAVGLASVMPVLAAGLLADSFGVVKVMFGIGLAVIVFWFIRLFSAARYKL